MAILNLANTIRRAYDLDALIKKSCEELKKLKAVILSQGAGEYEGANGFKALVIFPAPSIAPTEDALREVRRLVGAKVFDKLFVTETIFSPVKAFREVAAAIVKEDMLADVIAACEKKSPPQVRIS